jgi:outer membrane protein assembly factor BamB
MKFLIAPAWLVLSVALLAQTSPPAAPPGESAPAPTFVNTVRPFVEEHCQACHNGKVTSGDINFEVLKYSTSLAPMAAAWENTAYVLKAERMPPPGAARPPAEAVQSVIAVLERDLANLDQKRTSQTPATREWLTYQADPERTGWARAENTLGKTSVSRLALLWKAQLDAVPTRVNLHATLTDPLVVEDVQTKQGPKDLVLIASAENNVYALDADTGVTLWQRKFPTGVTPRQPANGTCPNNLNATPVIDKANGILYVLMNDGKLRGLGLADGDDRMTPVELTEPYSRNWSLNLIEGIIYTAASRGCGPAISGIFAADVANPNHPVYRFHTSTGKGSGPWGRGGIVRLPSGVIAQTADGVYDPASGRFGNTFVSLTRDLRLTDSYTPPNWEYLNRKDFDLGAASPTVFSFEKWTLVAAAAKEGVIYLLNAADLGGDDHHTPLYVSPRYGNDALTFGFTGVWGTLSTWVDAQGERWLLVPMQGPPAKDTVSQFPVQHGDVVNGSIMAFLVRKENDKPVLVPKWMSPDLDLPGMPVVANGVVYVLATGDRAGMALRGPRPGGGRPRGPGGRPRGGFLGPVNQVNVGEPGADRDAAWLSEQREADGQTPGRRFSGGRDVTHAVLYALDAETGKELYSSRDVIDSWNHYGGMALANGRLYVSSYDARVYAFGLRD